MLVKNKVRYKVAVTENKVAIKRHKCEM